MEKTEKVMENRGIFGNLKSTNPVAVLVYFLLYSFPLLYQILNPKTVSVMTKILSVSE